MAQGATFLWLSLMVISALPLLADGGWDRKSSARRRGTSSLVTSDLAALGGRLADRVRSPLQAPPTTAARRRAAGAAPASWRLHWRHGGDTPAFIQAPYRASKPLPGGSGRAPSAMALDLLEAYPDIFALRHPHDELRHLETVRGDDGLLRVRFARRVDGVQVWGEDLVVHLDGRGELLAFNGVYSATPPGDVPSPVIGADEALQRVHEHLGRRQQIDELPEPLRQLLAYDGPTATLMLRASDTAGYESVWRVEIRPNVRDRWIYTVDARSGDVVERYNATPWEGPVRAPAIDLNGVTRILNAFSVADSFLLIDASRPMFADVQPDVVGSPRGALVTLTAGQRDLTRNSQIDHVISSDNTWSDRVAVSAHTNMGTVCDYFLQTHGRLSIDGVGGSMYSVVHVTDEGQPMGNAFWSGTFIAYGDGGAAFEPLAEGLDVAAHEMSHGVIQNTVNLEYRNQSGALNESMADVFGVMVDRDDWRLGEDVVRSTRFFASGALRDMEDPHNGVAPGITGWQPAHMSEFRDLPLTEDNGGVHVNSGIPNRACFLIAEAIGRDKTEQIYYHILAARLINQRGNFDDMRNAAIQSATELYGADEVAAVEAAFTAVGVIGDEGYQAPQRRAPIPGEEFVLVVSAEPGDRGLYLAKPDLQPGDEIVLLTSTPVYDRTGNSVTVAADGSFVLFIDAANNLRVINIDGSDETVLSSTRDWASISLSPDGKRLAATTVFEDGTMVLIDLENPERSRTIELKRPTTQQGVTTSVVLYADALDWDPAGTFIIYDAFNAIPRATGDSLSFWDVSLLEPEEEFIVTLFPPQVDGIQLGNPTIARTSGRHVVFDRFDSRVDSNEVWVYDLVTGDAGQIISTGSAIGFPTFSADDRELLYERRDRSGRSLVARISLDDSRLQAVGEEREFLVGAQIPNWLVIADEEDPATSVGEAEAGATPVTFELLGNHPNPFNPTTTIRFQLAAAARVELSVFDVRGALVERLVQDTRAAGQHTVTWSGLDDRGREVASGVYLVRLRARLATGWTQDRTQRMTLIR